MSQIVTREALDALAALAFRAISDPGQPPKELDLDCAREELFHVLESAGKLEGHSKYSSGFAEGVGFGLIVAAAIINHGLDIEAAANQINDAIHEMVWPDEVEPEGAEPEAA